MTTTALLVATIVCIAANASIAVADYAGAGFVRKNSAEVHVPESALPYLATLKLAGAAGLVVGLTAWRWAGLAAGIGLTLFFTTAVATHLRTHVLHNIAFPTLYLLLALTATTYMTT
ncbi:DoxX family protein [Streptomyces sp. NPDC050560]|uniref:DoxX family protein n=1 Tax=Streptomyces sp. NPDC050560 TaxID=3365630 RepID=UPI00378C2A95